MQGLAVAENYGVLCFVAASGDSGCGRGLWSNFEGFVLRTKVVPHLRAKARVDMGHPDFQWAREFLW